MAGNSVIVTPWPGSDSQTYASDSQTYASDSQTYASDSQTYASGVQITLVCTPTYTGYPEPGLWRPDLWEEWLR